MVFVCVQCKQLQTSLAATNGPPRSAYQSHYSAPSEL